MDISKICMYDFHYNYMLKKFSLDSCKLLYTDTDSLIYELKCDDVYKDVIKSDIEKFDTSDYDENNVYKIPLVNKKVLGLMKDECKGAIITHFVGLRSKQYTFLVEQTVKPNNDIFVDEDDNMNNFNDRKTICVKKSKGVKSNVLVKNISFKHYLNCLQNKINKNVTQRLITSKRH